MLSSFLVGQDGGVYEGVGWNVQGCSTPGYSDIALGIVFMGTFSGELNELGRSGFLWCLEGGVSDVNSRDIEINHHLNAYTY